MRRALVPLALAAGCAAGPVSSLRFREVTPPQFSEMTRFCDDHCLKAAGGGVFRTTHGAVELFDGNNSLACRCRLGDGPDGGGTWEIMGFERTGP